VRRYLDPIDGLDAEIWVAPSRGQRFWLRHAPLLFAPPLHPATGDRPGWPARLARWWGIATVTPSTNVTGLSLRYQSYLNDVFHRTRLARVGHAVCMPLIVTAMLAALWPLRLGPVTAALPAAVGLAVWWAWWAVKERDPLWGTGCLALTTVLYLASGAVARYSPVGWLVGLVFVFSFLQAASHAREPLPPRVTRSPYWVPVGEYLLGRPGHRHRTGVVLRRGGQLAAQLAFGTVDELVASPRLLPVLVLELLWWLGHDPVRRAAWKELSARAIAAGNPALDYIGTGGATPLRVPAG
jgi:hypothetical protein